MTSAPIFVHPFHSADAHGLYLGVSCTLKDVDVGIGKVVLSLGLCLVRALCCNIFEAVFFVSVLQITAVGNEIHC